MNLLNLYFTPFAAAMVVAAVYFSEPDPRVKYAAFGILAFSLAVNHWFSRNTYRFVGWASRLKVLQVWLTYLWSALLAYMLMPYWAPMWLLLTMPAVTAAMYQKRWQTIGTAAVCSASVLALYWLNAHAQGMSLAPVQWAEAGTHAAFVLVLAAFVYELAQTALRMRDAALRH
ncbi:MAG: hypothetical protein KGL53_02025 [Elusimicrobia bacterium]|nr:hypothetical protein [Elusimicrobiota bacterium]